MPTVASLFSGAGGLDLGFKQAGFETIYANEFWPVAAQTFHANFGMDVDTRDIRDVKTIPHADVVIGGPPCQGFSGMNNADTSNDPRNELWREYFRLLRNSQPTAFVMENVAPLMNHRYFPDIIMAAREAGYHVRWWILDARSFGVASQRKRLFIIGNRLSVPAQPSTTHSAPAIQPSLFEIQQHRTVRDEIEWLADKDESFHPLMKDTTSPFFQEYFAAIPEGETYQFYLRGHADLWPDAFEKITQSCIRSKTMGSQYIPTRCAWDSPRRAILSNHQRGRHDGHPRLNRFLTKLELSLIQSFPLEYRWIGSLTQIQRQVGNSVPPRMAAAIANSIRV